MSTAVLLLAALLVVVDALHTAFVVEVLQPTAAAAAVRPLETLIGCGLACRCSATEVLLCWARILLRGVCGARSAGSG